MFIGEHITSSNVKGVSNTYLKLGNQWATFLLYVTTHLNDYSKYSVYCVAEPTVKNSNLSSPTISILMFGTYYSVDISEYF